MIAFCHLIGGKANASIKIGAYILIDTVPVSENKNQCEHKDKQRDDTEIAAMTL